MAVAATDAGVLHLGVDVEGAVAALAAVAVAASTLAAGVSSSLTPDPGSSQSNGVVGCDGGGAAAGSAAVEVAATDEWWRVAVVEQHIGGAFPGDDKERR